MNRTQSITPINIADRLIGPGYPTFVIAEIGVNHDGSANKALELVRIAANCGADAVKLQFFRATTLIHPSCRMAEYQKRQLATEDPIDMLRRYELSGDDVSRIVKNIRDLKMIPLATPFSPADLELVDRLRLPGVKIASPDLVNYPLLRAAARLGKPMILSTGASSLDEVQATVEWMRDWRASFSLLHCVSSYPTQPAQANLCWIGELANRFGVPVGYSDHTAANTAGALAAGAGACIVEKHLTYDRDARGPDHAASADPQQFDRYIRLLREADVLRGAPGKRVLDAEQDVRTVSRQSLVARRSLQAGERIREEDVTVQRPGTGLPAAQFRQVVGRTIVETITAGSMLQWEMLEKVSEAA